MKKKSTHEKMVETHEPETHEPETITQAQAAKRVRMSNQGLYKYIKDKNPAFVVRHEGKPPVIDIAHPAWSEFVKERKARTDIQPVKKYKKQSVSGNALIKKLEKKAKAIQAVEKLPDVEPVQAVKTPEPVSVEKVIETPELIYPIPPAVPELPPFQENPDFQKNMELALKAEIAVREQEISKAEISKQKAIQEELRTLEMKKNTAPIELVEFFFSFAENMIQRIYRRPHEINADLESLYMAGKKDMAVNKIIREMEAIVKDVQAELIDKMKQEGFKRGVK